MGWLATLAGQPRRPSPHEPWCFLLTLRREGQRQQRFLFDLVRFGAARRRAGAGAAFYRHHVARPGDAFETREHVE